MIQDHDTISLPANWFDRPSHAFDYDHRYNVLVSQILWEAQRTPSPVILDIGCGAGIGGQSKLQHTVASVAGCYWGVEPDVSIAPQSVFHKVWPTVLEAATDIPDQSVDIAYSYMVLEHIVSPAAFVGTLHRILKPGGVFVAITVNRQSLFGTLSCLCHRLHIQDGLLRILRGKKLVDEYHYPAVYALNAPQHFQAAVQSASVKFDTIDYSYLECGEILPYFSGVLRPMGHLLVYYSKQRPRRFVTLMVRMKK